MQSLPLAEHEDAEKSSQNFFCRSCLFAFWQSPSLDWKSGLCRRRISEIGLTRIAALPSLLFPARVSGRINKACQPVYRPAGFASVLSAAATQVDFCCCFSKGSFLSPPPLIQDSGGCKGETLARHVKGMFSSLQIMAADLGKIL